MTNLDRLRTAVAEINELSHHKSEVEAPDAQGIRWAWMGHNSTHQFELGVDAEDRVWRRSSGEEFNFEGYEAANCPVDRDYEFRNWEVGEPRLIEGGFAGVGYVGHW